MRRRELDLCRLVACFTVILAHSLGEFFWKVPLDSADFKIIIFLSSMIRGTIPLFFMISGILFLGRDRMNLKKTVQRAFRLIGLFFFWSTVYALARLATGQVESPDAFLTLVIQGHYHLWFLPAMAICYFLLPLVHSAFHGKRLSLGYMLILLLLIPVVYKTSELFHGANARFFLLTRVFSLEYVPYVGYAIWGAWLDSRPMPKQLRWIAPLVWLAVSVLATLVNYRISLTAGWAEGRLFDSFSLSSFLQGSAILCFFLSWKGEGAGEGSLLPALSDATLGVYLIHPMLIALAEKLRLIPESLDPLLRLTLLFCFLTLTSFPLVILAKKIPLIRKLM